MSSSCAKEMTLICLPNGVIKDIKFVDDNSLMLVWSDECKLILLCWQYDANQDIVAADSSRLLCFPYGGTLADPNRLPYVSLPENVGKNFKQHAHNLMACLDVSDVSSLAPYTRHIFSREDPGQPEKLEVNGRKGRRVVCVLDHDGLRYRVFDLDSNADIALANQEAGEGQVSGEDAAMSE